MSKALAAAATASALVRATSPSCGARTIAASVVTRPFDDLALVVGG